MANSTPTSSQNSGLAYWMQQVQAEIVRVADGFKNDPVHDLRVALRRCRSMVDGLRALDPDKSWKKMRRQATELFDSLGELRDCHVLMEWVEKLGAPDDAVTQRLLSHIRAQEHLCKQQAQAALNKFDQKRWSEWVVKLPRRARRLRPGSDAFKTLAVEKWTRARKFESAALKTESPEAFHRLRIGVKKLRYVIENFLPTESEEWAGGFKKVQDLLGEIHDLDVLLSTAASIAAFTTPEEEQRWKEQLRGERNSRIVRYKEKMVGSESLWKVWRAGLPSGARARQASLGKLRAWSSFLDSDLQHSRRVARLALQLHDGLADLNLVPGREDRSRELLQAAATVYEVGRHAGAKDHHKATQRMVGDLERLPGWSRGELALIGTIARYHRGALPSAASLNKLPRGERRLAKVLAGILRLANAFDAEHAGQIKRIKVSKKKESVLVQAEGFNAESALAEKLAGARYLLELSCGSPIVIRGLAPARKAMRSKPSPRPRQSAQATHLRK